MLVDCRIALLPGYVGRGEDSLHESTDKQGHITYYRNYDFASSYACLSRAGKIAEESGLVFPAIDLHIGIIYQTIGEQCADSVALKFALNCYQKGFSDALAVRDTTVVDVLASNITNLAFSIGRLSSINEVWNKYRRLLAANPNQRYEYNIGMFEGLSYLQAGEYDRCIAVFDSLMQHPPADGTVLRYRLAALLNQVTAMTAKGDHYNAIRILKEALGLAENNSVKDAQIEIFGKLANSFRCLGDTVRALEYENKSLRLSDSLINYGQLSRMENIKSERNIRKYRTRLADVENQRKLQRTVITITAVFIVLLSLLIFVLIIRNRRLRNANRMLYDKIVENVRAKAPGHISEQGCRQNEVVKQETNSNGKEKYRNSQLDEVRKTELSDKITGVMESTDEWLSPDFTIDRLAELAGEKSKLVSQVINEIKGCNFNSFINDFRIKEACRRIADNEHYGRLTLEAISKSVGFRARSSFFSAFKSITGLTPSEFQKIALEKAKKTNNSK